MYTRKDSDGGLTKEFKEGLEIFMYQAGNMQTTLQSGKMFCPCRKCQNTRYIFTETVWNHLLNRGFMPHYYVWFQHGEGFERSQSDVGTSNCQGRVEFDDQANDLGQQGHGQHDQGQDHDRIHDMVNDAFRETNADNSVEEPNVEAKQFYDMLEAANKPLYRGCREGHSKLSLAARMMTIKTDHNLSEVCMDDWADLIKEILPEDNIAAETYYQIQKLVSSLGLPSEMIDVCVDNCMLFWKDDENLQECRYCQKPRFRPQTSGRSQIPYQRMWYLPITDRLKRLYQSERTAASMRWHAEHSQREGEVTHPSDAKAWKHFNTVHKDFAKFKRNVYLGLCTDGFSPFSMSGRQYSLWPVIVTPYNLPPGMCMQREFLFLNILVPGPNHPKRSLDVFLQPLIDELKTLWYVGVRTYDCSTKTNFTMRAVLMWTISDFPAYGMLSGWTTHGRLSCPYCLDRTDAFQLKHGRKTCWFDCHRRFLPSNHPYRRNKRSFIKNKIVRVPPPVYLSGEALEMQIDYFGAQETVVRGGNWHTPANMPYGYCVNHNWHKKSIFWELPYWKDHLLRHNLDVMHIEKNFFDNIMHTVLNVKGTKDSAKSRLDLPDICNRNELHILSDGQSPVPIFRLGADQKAALFNWVSSDVKFPDGYVSNLAKSVAKGKKFSGMKSHDCHVFMQRLLPFAFAELLPVEVHEAIGGIRAFFRDLCTRTLSEDVIAQLDANIPILLCNLEKIFPPAFFDVMEHLPIHLPHEAELGGPVQFRWMYPFERFFKHLKGKAKNLARPEGSVVAGSLTAETTHFTSYYFASNVRTRNRRPRRYDDGGVGRTYAVPGVPDIFSPIGRLSGQLKEVWWSSEDDRHSAHTYILLNCEEMEPYESLFVSQVQECFEGISEVEITRRKDSDFAKWLKLQVDHGDPEYPIWFHELLQGPLGKITTAPMYFTRGYVFHTYTYGVRRATANYGVCVRGEIDFYGVLQEIIEVEYPGFVKLKCVIFKCDWYDPTVGRGVRYNKFGMVDVNSSRRYSKFEPFVLASQAEQVTFVPYPRLRKSGPKWLAVIKISPRGHIVGVEDLPLQEDSCLTVSEPEITEDSVLLIDPNNRQLEHLRSDTEEEASDEFAESEDDEEPEEDDRSEDGESDEDDD